MEIFITSLFEKSIKNLSKKYRNIKKVFKQVIEDITDNPYIGDEIENHKGFYKVRYPNKDANKGKSGGYRVIYYYYIKGYNIILIDIYSKSFMSNVDWNKVNKELKDLGNERV
jgi:mRNA-degrading endonuclease RelE of RelBE toxin-antitoxin system